MVETTTHVFHPAAMCAVCSAPLGDDLAGLHLVRAVQVARWSRDVGHMTEVAVGACLMFAIYSAPSLPRRITFATCSGECRDVVARAIDAETRRAEQPSADWDVTYPPQVQNADAAGPRLEDDHPFFKYECALCGATLNPDASVRLVDAVQLIQHGPDLDDLLTSVRIAGREVQAMGIGEGVPREILLMTCDDVCAERLRRAIDDEAARGIGHATPAAPAERPDVRPGPLDDSFADAERLHSGHGFEASRKKDIVH